MHDQLHDKKSAVEKVLGNTKEPASEREVVIQRVMDVPARFLFLAASTPEHVKQWFGPRGWPVTTCEMEFRVGGRIRMQMTGPNGEKGPPFGGEYLEIEKDKKVSFANGFFEPGSETMIMTMTYVEKGGKTTLTHHTLFQSVAMFKHHTAMGFLQGVTSSIDLFTELVTRLAHEQPPQEMR